MITFDAEATQHEILAIIARRLPVKRFLEVGVRDGCTLWTVIEAGRVSLAACADDWGTVHGGTGRGSHDHIHRLLHAIGYYVSGGEVKWLDGRSQETLPDLLRREPQLKFDLVHVDGDHDEQPAYEDLVNGWALLREGGALVAHDAKHPPVARALHRFAMATGADVWVRVGGHGTAVAWRAQ